MKKISTLLALTLGLSASAQISTIPDENIDPADSLEIIRPICTRPRRRSPRPFEAG